MKTKVSFFTWASIFVAAVPFVYLIFIVFWELSVGCKPLDPILGSSSLTACPHYFEHLEATFLLSPLFFTVSTILGAIGVVRRSSKTAVGIFIGSAVLLWINVLCIIAVLVFLFYTAAHITF
jgi:hypothetical protein